MLCAHGAVPVLAQLLDSSVSDARMATLDCIAALCYKNHRIATVLTISRYIFALSSFLFSWI